MSHSLSALPSPTAARPARRATLRLALRVMAACAELVWRGARIHSAHVHPAPAILIVEPGPGVIAAYGYRPPPRGGRGPVCCIAQLGGVRVYWYSRGVAA